MNTLVLLALPLLVVILALIFLLLYAWFDFVDTEEEKKRKKQFLKEYNDLSDEKKYHLLWDAGIDALKYVDNREDAFRRHLELKEINDK